MISSGLTKKRIAIPCENGSLVWEVPSGFMPAGEAPTTVSGE